MSFEPTLQGLRAIAVLAVLVFHTQPHLVPGGFVGVDVFFVISGYLITGSLLREHERDGQISLVGFYGRRVRRLLPAATLVLVAVAACYRLLPAVEWENLGKSIAASALYVQNWWLGYQAVDYLAAEESPGPLQHYWSLSIEEQFYIVWPLLLATLARRQNRRLLAAGIAFVALASLVHSVLATARDPAWAYFATSTRVWELAMGGLLAVWSVRLARIAGGPARVLVGAGVTAIVVPCLMYSVRTPFPGWTALVPTVGAAMVIAGGVQRAPTGLGHLLANRWAQFIGDVSYSLYLWHWPVIVFLSAAFERPLDPVEAVGAMAASVLLAYVSKVVVEDRFRFGFTTRAGPTFGLAAGLIAVTVGAGAAVGAASATGDSSDDALVELARRARHDLPAVYERGCHVNQRSTQARTCEFGRTNAPVNIALIGDSHAAQWVPTVGEMAKSRGWALKSYTKSACPMGETPLERKGVPYASCDGWRANVLAALRESEPDLVVVTQSRKHTPAGMAEAADVAIAERLAEGVVALHEALRDAGLSAVWIADTPRVGMDGPVCLTTPGNGPRDCRRPRDAAFTQADPILIAAAGDPSISVIDLNGLICPGDWCPAVINGQLVWRDEHHVTASFARRATKAFAEKLSAVWAPPAQPSLP